MKILFLTIALVLLACDETGTTPAVDYDAGDTDTDTDTNETADCYELYVFILDACVDDCIEILLYMFEHPEVSTDLEGYSHEQDTAMCMHYCRINYDEDLAHCLEHGLYAGRVADAGP